MLVKFAKSFDWRHVNSVEPPILLGVTLSIGQICLHCGNATRDEYCEMQRSVFRGQAPGAVG